MRLRVESVQSTNLPCVGANHARFKDRFYAPSFNRVSWMIYSDIQYIE